MYEYECMIKATLELYKKHNSC